MDKIMKLLLYTVFLAIAGIAGVSFPFWVRNIIFISIYGAIVGITLLIYKELRK